MKNSIVNVNAYGNIFNSLCFNVLKTISNRNLDAFTGARSKMRYSPKSMRIEGAVLLEDISLGFFGRLAGIDQISRMSTLEYNYVPVYVNLPYCFMPTGGSG